MAKVLLFCVPGKQQRSNASLARQFCDYGIRAESAGEFRKARNWFRRAREIDSCCLVARWYLGSMQLRRKRYQSSLKIFKEIATIAPASKLIWLNIGYCYYKLDLLQEAAQAYRSGVNFGCQDSCFNLAMLMDDTKDYSSALLLWQRYAEFGRMNDAEFVRGRIRWLASRLSMDWKILEGCLKLPAQHENDQSRECAKISICKR